jgi:hypothetical protein
VASGSNGGEISAIASWSSPSAGVLDVASTTGWPSSGTVNVAASGSTTAVVTYTGKTSTSLTGCAYVSGSATGTVSTGGAVDLISLSPWSSGNVCTNAFTAPPSGAVLIEASFVLQPSASGADVMLGLAATGTLTPLFGNTITTQFSAATTLGGFSAVKFYVTGLAPGTSYQFDLLGVATSGDTATIYAYGVSSTLLGSKGAPVVMTVQGI